MSAEDFAKKHPEVADLIIDRGFRARSLINQYGGCVATLQLKTK